jgi:hypothetical protein
VTTLGEMFGQFQHTAFRCEARDSYLMTDRTRYELWASGAPLQRKTRETDGWIATIQDAKARGAVISRDRVVGHPITDYTRFEFTAFRDNVRAGEDIQVVERRLLDSTWVDVPDFWLFDDEIAFVQHYDDQGGFLGADQADDVTPFLEVRASLASVTVPFGRYELSDIPQQRAGLDGQRVGPLPLGLQHARR